ncbi:hypothetical protein [Frigoriglobus tundricola]|uniref:Uncharacterized protein n=1 Tax=Frigoriglobus tundricola TaxID=2774151 RepID=A0A6M5YKY4_9BACT|nr:hypothetical protein [Frigoriglobus tundricola]QJW94605.1 hypothetical protein FTUN_2127 [Frigoriglobus tundricola]
MSKHLVENEEVEFDIVAVLDEIQFTDPSLWFVLIAGGTVGGCMDATGAYIMSRCLVEVETRHAFNAAGRFVRVPHSEWAKSTAKAKRVRDRVRRALRAGQQAGAEFVLCYHIEGDPRWYLEWSDNHDQESAVEALKQYLRSMPWV